MNKRLVAFGSKVDWRQFSASELAGMEAEIIRHDALY